MEDVKLLSTKKQVVESKFHFTF